MLHCLFVLILEVVFHLRKMAGQPITLSLPTQVEVELGCDNEFICVYFIYKHRRIEEYFCLSSKRNIYYKELFKSFKMFINSTEKYEETQEMYYFFYWNLTINNEQTNVFNLKLQIACGAFRKSCYWKTYGSWHLLKWYIDLFWLSEGVY